LGLLVVRGLGSLSIPFCAVQAPMLDLTVPALFKNVKIVVLLAF
jgi:hypothetical protein